jgi:hypothetical protein
MTRVLPKLSSTPKFHRIMQQKVIEGLKYFRLTLCFGRCAYLAPLAPIKTACALVSVVGTDRSSVAGMQLIISSTWQGRCLINGLRRISPCVVVMPDARCHDSFCYLRHHALLSMHVRARACLITFCIRNLVSTPTFVQKSEIGSVPIRSMTAHPDSCGPMRHRQCNGRLGMTRCSTTWTTAVRPA